MMATGFGLEDSPSFELPGRGRIIGRVIHDAASRQPKVHRFTGIPYALPPVAERRFQKPAPLPTDFQYDSDGQKYDDFSAACHQPTNYVIPYGPPPPSPLPPQTEDCLYLNIWVPAHKPAPEQGWPIFFMIHGGWLQVGNAYQDPIKDFSDFIAPAELGGVGMECVVVCPAYRLNIFGFISSEALDAEHGQANFGYWDQRAALEWTAEHAQHFGGNASNITIAGLSAGAQSAHAQLLFEYSCSQTDPSYRPLIRRCLLRSGTALLPCKTFAETREQLVEVCNVLNLKAETDEDRILGLRGVPADKLVSIIPELKMHTFRAVRDGGWSNGGFVDSGWGEEMRKGHFATWCTEKGISLMLGEAAQEEQLYRLVNPPRHAPWYDETVLQIYNYYPIDVVKELQKAYEAPESSDLDADHWADYFGSVTSDAQVFAAQRLLIGWMRKIDPSLVLRYRLERRAAFIDDWFPDFMGVFHGSDDALFGFNQIAIASAKDQREARRDIEVFSEWLQPFRAWIWDKDMQSVVWPKWSGGVPSGDQVRTMRRDGLIEMASDPVADAKAAAVKALDDAIVLRSTK